MENEPKIIKLTCKCGKEHAAILQAGWKRECECGNVLYIEAAKKKGWKQKITIEGDELNFTKPTVGQRLWWFGSEALKGVLLVWLCIFFMAIDPLIGVLFTAGLIFIATRKK